jgi:hypothetical protein
MTRRRDIRIEFIGAAYDRYAASLFRCAAVMLGRMLEPVDCKL